LSALRYDIGFDLDDPRTTLAHRDIIRAKPFLERLYKEWYGDFIDRISNVPPGELLEIGSGGGFLKELIPQVITSDVMPLDCCEMTFSAERMPFHDGELSAVMMLNVFHHIPRPWMFLQEAERTLKTGGKVVMTEPANSLMGRFIYRNFHHEPFEPEGAWEIAPGGPLSGSNQALPFIYFERDRAESEKRFPCLRINAIRYHTPFRYVLSGGVSRKALVPNSTFGFFKGLESLLAPLSRWLGLFMTVELEKVDGRGSR